MPASMPMSGSRFGTWSLRDLERLALGTRRTIVETLWRTGTGHPGPSLSIVELLVALYFAELATRPDDPGWLERDRFVLSKGHGALALYVVLAQAGYFPVQELDTFESLGSRLQGHPDALTTPGVEMSTGSLGQGLSVSVGMALGARLKGQSWRSYCLLGDGELQEGSVWEAAMSAAKYELDSLVAIVDRNGLQGGVTSVVMPSLEPLDEKWRAFGWHVLEIDGHDIAAILGALETARSIRGRPTIVIANTIKGQGVSYMAGNNAWHSAPINEAQYRQAVLELDARAVELGFGA